uniref:Translation initiation factor beta propellor-like domain-containing protein n=1 Tax=Leersia perrieri TaxID=77586 RepID=A0A0D9VFI3_9ORYZ
MDLLSSAYGATSDDDDADAGGTDATPTPSWAVTSFSPAAAAPPPLKRPRWEPLPYLPPPPHPVPQPAPPFRAGPPPASIASGRYVSKRERALLAASRSPAESPSPHPPSGAGEVGSAAHLLASAGMDHTVHVFNVWSKGNTTARVFKFHTSAVKDMRWSLNGFSLLSGGLDCSLRLVDVEKGKEIKVFKEDQAVEVVKFNPSNSNLFLSGGSKGSLRLWDIRSGLVTKEYQRSLGTILDIEFSSDGKQFICSTDTSRSNISENSIIIWDTLRQVPLSNQVYTEAYTCPCVRYHPFEASFVAQSNGNYIAMFSARSPFRLNKYMRYEGHGVWGFPIKCNFSFSGKELASGSSDGCIYFYDYKSSRLLSKIEAFKEPCTDVAYHPVMPNNSKSALQHQRHPAGNPGVEYRIWIVY